MTYPADYLPLLHGLGWLAGLMFIAVWAGLPDGIGRRRAGWLLGFCAARLLLATQSLLFPRTAEWRQVAAVLSGMILWEFARRVWNDAATRRISAFTHVLAVECLVLVGALALAGGSTGPAWFLPVDLLYTTLPGILGAGAAWVLWRHLAAEPAPRRRAALRLAVVGLALSGIQWEAVAVLPPWIAATGFGLACFAVPATRTPAALGCAAGLALVALLGPPAVSLSQQQPDATAQADLLERAVQAAAPLQGKFAAALAPERIAPAIREPLRRQLEKIRATDSLVRTVTLCRLRDGRVWIADLATGRFSDARPALAEELAVQAHAGAFVMPADPAAGRGSAIACAPLSPGLFENPVAWLSLEFPDIFWEMQRQYARRTGIALVGVLAICCAMGFVLVVRQQLEAAQELNLERTQAADRAKTEFLAFLGHELRTPLQTILGRAELLRAQPAAERHAAAIEAQGRLLLRLVTDLLDLGTIEAGHFQLRPAPFSLRRALAAVEDTARAPADAKNLELRCCADPAVPDAWIGDEARLRQILGNLLGNAVKFTSRGRVELDIRSGTDGRLVFTVRDSGPGLPIDKIPQLFTLFTRLDSGDTFTREGTGVGLALVQRLCRLMGGSVSAANRPEGGAEFTVHLAFPAAEAASVVAAPISFGQPAGRRRAVLLAEDNTATRELLAEALGELGHDVVAVADGTAALVAATARDFDVAVLDINLPGVDGVEIARQLRRHATRIRLIGCSAEALPGVRAAALAAGFDEFVVKPVPLATLARAVDETAGVPGPSLFDCLNSPAAQARTRALLISEWPRLRTETEIALGAGDDRALARLGHYLQSSGLLLADAALLELCRRLSAPTLPPRATAWRLLDEISQHFDSWQGEPTTRLTGRAS